MAPKNIISASMKPRFVCFLGEPGSNLMCELKLDLDVVSLDATLKMEIKDEMYGSEEYLCCTFGDIYRGE